MDIKSRNTEKKFKQQKIWRRLEKDDDKLFKRDICCFDFRSNFLVLISILLNIGKERNEILLL